MLKRNVGTTGEQLKPAADVPASSVAGVQLQRSIDQAERAFDVVAESCNRERHPPQHARIFVGGLNRSVSEGETVAPVRGGVRCPAKSVDLHMALV